MFSNKKTINILLQDSHSSPETIFQVVFALEGANLNTTNTSSLRRFRLTPLGKHGLKRKQAKASSIDGVCFVCVCVLREGREG